MSEGRMLRISEPKRQEVIRGLRKLRNEKPNIIRMIKSRI
jgi:hypothetical protein